MKTLDYHARSKHSPESVRASRHFLDWPNKPHPFKDYVGLEPIALRDVAPDTDYPAPDALAGHLNPAVRDLDLTEMTRLLALSAGVIRVKTFPDGERFFFRTYACAGALYPVEVYVACSRVGGLDPGIYHFHPREKSLRMIREGDPKPYLSRATAVNDSVTRARATVILSGIPWRTAWKYEARGYRHLFWDAGMIVANLLALAASGGHVTEVVLGFVDHEVNALIGVDGTKEMAVALVTLGIDSDDAAAVAPDAPAPIEHDVHPLSRREKDYDELLDAHAASVLTSPEETRAWRRSPRSSVDGRRGEHCRDAIEKVIRRRGSSRAFSHRPIGRDHFNQVIAGGVSPLAADWAPPLVKLALIINAVDNLSPGAYRIEEGGFELVAEGDLRDEASFLCLQQPLGGDAATTVFLVSDLAEATETLGPRGYRAAQLEAGIRAGRLYLGAYACGFGATGLTFYDDEVRKFFQTTMEPMLVVALGHPSRGRRLL